MTAKTAPVPHIDHKFAPRGACAELFACRDPEVLVAGPAGTGKSRACLEKLHIMMLLNPGARGLIARKAATTLSSTALVTWRKFVAKEAIASGDMHYYGGSAQEPASYQYKNGSVIAIGGLDKASKIMSSEYDVVYVQEATELTEDDWESITTRLRNWQISFQQLIADCNPQNPEHWLKVRCDRGTTTMLESVHEDNPLLFSIDGVITTNGKQYIAKLDALTGVRHKRLRLGKWVAAEGVIYEGWSNEHLLNREDIRHNAGDHVDRNGIPMAWPRYWAVDFGFTNPFVCQFWAEDPDGRLYLYREIYHTKRTVEDHARQMMSLVTNARGSWIEPRPRAIVCDHDAEGRATLENKIGMSTEAAHKSVLEGIDAVQGRMKIAGDDRPRVFVLRDALVERDEDLAERGKPVCTAQEIPGYVWADKKTKEEPEKQDDHGCDAMRYVIAQRDFGTRVLYRSFEA
jgi:PBSX family phage terminase large subunit